MLKKGGLTKMKVITDKKIINLDSFDAVEYKALFGGFSVEATFMGEKEKN